jgi:hypothetical protein
VTAFTPSLPALSGGSDLKVAFTPCMRCQAAMQLLGGIRSLGQVNRQCCCSVERLNTAPPVSPLLNAKINMYLTPPTAHGTIPRSRLSRFLHLRSFLIPCSRPEHSGLGSSLAAQLKTIIPSTRKLQTKCGAITYKPCNLVSRTCDMGKRYEQMSQTCVN